MNANSGLILSSLSFPNTAPWIIFDDDWWKFSYDVPLTAPLILLAIVLHALPTKSLTLNNANAESLSVLLTLKNQFYDNFSLNLAWSDVSTINISVIKSGPNTKDNVLIAPSFLGLPPDNDKTVNSSSGANETISGPNTTLDLLSLKSYTCIAVLWDAFNVTTLVLHLLL